MFKIRNSQKQPDFYAPITQGNGGFERSHVEQIYDCRPSVVDIKMATGRTSIKDGLVYTPIRPDPFSPEYKKDSSGAYLRKKAVSVVRDVFPPDRKSLNLPDNIVSRSTEEERRAIRMEDIERNGNLVQISNKTLDKVFDKFDLITISDKIIDMYQKGDLSKADARASAILQLAKELKVALEEGNMSEIQENIDKINKVNTNILPKIDQLGTTPEQVRDNKALIVAIMNELSMNWWVDPVTMNIISKMIEEGLITLNPDNKLIDNVIHLEELVRLSIENMKDVLPHMQDPDIRNALQSIINYSEGKSSEPSEEEKHDYPYEPKPTVDLPKFIDPSPSFDPTFLGKPRIIEPATESEEKMKILDEKFINDIVDILGENHSIYKIINQIENTLSDEDYKIYAPFEFKDLIREALKSKKVLDRYRRTLDFDKIVDEYFKQKKTMKSVEPEEKTMESVEPITGPIEKFRNEVKKLLDKGGNLNTLLNSFRDKMLIEDMIEILSLEASSKGYSQKEIDSVKKEIESKNIVTIIPSLQFYEPVKGLNKKQNLQLLSHKIVDEEKKSEDEALALFNETLKRVTSTSQRNLLNQKLQQTIRKVNSVQNKQKKLLTYEKPNLSKIVKNAQESKQELEKLDEEIKNIYEGIYGEVVGKEEIENIVKESFEEVRKEEEEEKKVVAPEIKEEKKPRLPVELPAKAPEVRQEEEKKEETVDIITRIKKLKADVDAGKMFFAKRKGPDVVSVDMLKEMIKEYNKKVKDEGGKLDYQVKKTTLLNSENKIDYYNELIKRSEEWVLVKDKPARAFLSLESVIPAIKYCFITNLIKTNKKANEKKINDFKFNSPLTIEKMQKDIKKLRISIGMSNDKYYRTMQCIIGKVAGALEGQGNLTKKEATFARSLKEEIKFAKGTTTEDKIDLMERNFLTLSSMFTVIKSDEPAVRPVPKEPEVGTAEKPATLETISATTSSATKGKGRPKKGMGFSLAETTEHFGSGMVLPGSGLRLPGEAYISGRGMETNIPAGSSVSVGQGMKKSRGRPKKGSGFSLAPIYGNGLNLPGSSGKGLNLPGSISSGKGCGGSSITSVHTVLSKGRGIGKTNGWVEHLKEFRKMHPEKSYKECMSLARATYK